MTTWPRITLITATLNRGGWLPRMLQSVAIQDYPNLEFFVLDGGSRDDTCEQLKAAGSLISRWVSQPDRGQADALNQGVSWASGELVGWLNSDDLLLPGALYALAQSYRQGGGPLLLGNVELRDLAGQQNWTLRQRNISLRSFTEPWRYPVTWAQPGTYFSRELFERTGPLRTDMHHLFDWEWMCRALRLCQPTYLDKPVAAFHYHPQSKTSKISDGWVQDKRLILDLHSPAWLRRQPDLLEACLDLALAQDCWACHWREQCQGWDYFCRAVRHNPRILLWSRTWIAAIKSLLPPGLQRFVRARMHGY